MPPPPKVIVILEISFNCGNPALWLEILNIFLSCATRRRSNVCTLCWRHV